MGTSIRKEKEYNIRRDDMISAARKLFFSKGFRETTMDNIAKEAEFTKRTLYSYFISKYDLFFAVINQAVAENSYTYDEALASKEIGIEKLYAFAERYYKCYKENPHYLELLKNRWEVISNRNKVNHTLLEESKEMTKKNHARLLKAFEVGKIDGSIRIDLNVNIGIDYFMNALQMICSQVFYYEHIPESYYYENLELILRSFRSLDNNNEKERI